MLLNNLSKKSKLDIIINEKFTKIFETKYSNIAGKGNFAIINIPINTNLGIGFIKVNNTGNIDCDLITTNLLRFMNHSNTPNVCYKKNNGNYEIISIKHIYSGEELTIDYTKFDFEGNTNFIFEEWR